MLTPDHRVLCWKIVGRARTTAEALQRAKEYKLL